MTKSSAVSLIAKKSAAKKRLWTTLPVKSGNRMRRVPYRIIASGMITVSSGMTDAAQMNTIHFRRRGRSSA